MDDHNGKRKLNETTCNNKFIVCGGLEESTKYHKQNNRCISNVFVCLSNFVFSLCLVHTIQKCYERYEGEMNRM